MSENNSNSKYNSNNSNVQRAKEASLKQYLNNENKKAREPETNNSNNSNVKRAKEASLKQFLKNENKKKARETKTGHSSSVTRRKVAPPPLPRAVAPSSSVTRRAAVSRSAYSRYMPGSKSPSASTYTRRNKSKCSLNDMNHWDQIEDWVVNCARINNIPIQRSDTLTNVGVLGPKFCELAKSIIYEAGHYGPTGGNDCLIHSLLSCLSSSFRRITDNITRNIIASIFRRKLLVNWESSGFIRIRNKDDDLNGKNFLSEDLGEDLCKKFKINTLWVQKVPGINPAARFVGNEFPLPQFDYTICIFGTNVHFQPVELNGNYMLRDFDGENYVNKCFP